MAEGKEFDRIAPADNAFNIVQDADLPRTIRGIYVGGTGNLRVRMASNTELTFTNIQGGVIHPLRIIRVYSGGTTATGLIGIV